MRVPVRIVVTGATGFLGPFVVRALVRRFPQASIRCFVRPTSDRRRLTGLSVEFAEGNLYETTSVSRALVGADTLVNLASLGFDWIDSLFTGIRRSALERGVFISTTAILTTLPVQSRPLRERGEQMVRDSGLAWTILRPTMIYGTGEDRNIARLIRFVQRSPIVPMVAGGGLQQPVHVEDVAGAVAACLATPATIGHVYNLSGRDPLTFEILVRETARAAGRRCLAVPVPIAAATAVVKLYNRLVSKPRVTVEQVRRLAEDKAFDHQAARDAFGFSPRSFSEGVREEVETLRYNEGRPGTPRAGGRER